MNDKLHVTVERNFNQLFLGLNGDIDNDSVDRVREMLADNQDPPHTLYIGTSGLRRVSIDGRRAFGRLLRDLGSSVCHLVIYGENASRLLS